MKKLIIFSGILAAAAFVALVFSFCTKQTEKSSVNDRHNVKTQKATPDCHILGRQLVVLNVKGICIVVCIDCNSLRNGSLESCFNLCDNPDPSDDCQHYPNGTCCPYPLNIEYRGPQPATPILLRMPQNWQWSRNSDPSSVYRLTGGLLSANDLLQIVADPALGCF